MMASIFLAKNGFDTTVVEHNEKLGKKLFITGKGRCNLTNASGRDKFFDSVLTNPKFLYGAYGRFGSEDVMRFFEEAGLRLKVERGNRVFPVSDHAFDVTDTLKKLMKKYHVRVMLNTEAVEILTRDDNSLDNCQQFNCTGYKSDSSGLENNKSENITDDTRSGYIKGNVSNIENVYKETLSTCNKKHKAIVCAVAIKHNRKITELPADRVIVATGGLSYPSTGSTGDGFRFAKKLDIKVKPCVPSLTSLHIKEHFVSKLAGLTLKNVAISILDEKGKKVFEDFGEMLFTHRGISGPIVLSASANIAGRSDISTLKALIDLKPAVSESEFDKRLIKLLEENSNKDIINAIHGVYLSSITPVILDMAGIDPYKKSHEIRKAERAALVRATKHFELSIEKTGGFDEAVITKGGVDVKEIDPKTMMVKKIPGLYFVGEVLDLDALTGGYNLQIAWSTAYAAGNDSKFTEVCFE